MYYARISLQNILKSGFALLIYHLSNVGCDVIIKAVIIFILGSSILYSRENIITQWCVNANLKVVPMKTIVALFFCVTLLKYIGYIHQIYHTDSCRLTILQRFPCQTS